ncbi:mCG140696, isoform CRA_b, partial [Mus musculus]
DGNASIFCTGTAIGSRAAFKIPGSLPEMFEYAQELKTEGCQIQG